MKKLLNKVFAGPVNSARDPLEKHNLLFSKKKKKKGETLGPVWYMCLKTENCYLKTFVKIRVSEKMCRNT